MATHCWRRSRNFFITLRVSSGGIESISCWILSFTSSRERGLCLKTFSFRYPQRKKSHGRFDRARSVYRALSVSLSQNGRSHNMLQQQSSVVHRSSSLWVMKTVEANQPHDTTPVSLPLLQPAQCPLEMWEIFMLYPAKLRYVVLQLRGHKKNIEHYSYLPMKKKKSMLIGNWTDLAMA